MLKDKNLNQIYMKKWLKENQKKILHELRSFLLTVVAVFTVDSIIQIQAVINGDFRDQALLALIVGVGRAVFKAALKMVIEEPLR